MKIMISEVYDALKDAGASEEKSRAAAEAVAFFDNRFKEMELRNETRFGRIESELRTLTWMAGFTLAGTVTLLWKVFSK